MKKSFKTVAGIGLLASAALLAGCQDTPNASYTVQASDKTEVTVQAPAGGSIVTLTTQDGKRMTCVMSFNRESGTYTNDSKLVCPVTKATAQKRIDAAAKKRAQRSNDDFDDGMMMSTTTIMMNSM